MGSAKEGAPDFVKFKASLAQAGKLFEDRDFPADPSSIGGTRPVGDIYWKRPLEVDSSAKFIEKGATRFDLYQGDLGNCWFVAACACLATSHQQLFEWCIPSDQEFDRSYAGVFRFRFWQFGKWVEVLIDDLLPFREVVSSGQKSYELVYARNKEQPNEFWVPLFEKAYAKFNGSYTNLDSGLVNDALVDFTGGISERIDVATKRRSPGNLFETLNTMMKMASLVGTHMIIPSGKVVKSATGLYSGHAYSVTGIEQLRGTQHHLMRLRNPWGKSEWNGPWSDGSKEWDSVPDSVKREIDFEKLEDGEFWISFEDWLKNFNRMAMCHLSPDSLTKEICDCKGKDMWEEHMFKADWVTGINAGGSGGYSNNKVFWTNPQFTVSLKQSDQRPDGTCHMVVSLMQKAQNNQYSLVVGFGVAQLREGVPLRPLGQTYNESEAASTKMVDRLPFREVSEHFELTPGNYVVIPCTQFANTDGEFLLRIYTESQGKL